MQDSQHRSGCHRRRVARARRKVERLSKNPNYQGKSRRSRRPAVRRLSAPLRDDAGVRAVEHLLSCLTPPEVAWESLTKTRRDSFPKDQVELAHLALRINRLKRYFCFQIRKLDRPQSDPVRKALNWRVRDCPPPLYMPDNKARRGCHSRLCPWCWLKSFSAYVLGARTAVRYHGEVLRLLEYPLASSDIDGILEERKKIARQVKAAMVRRKRRRAGLNSVVLTPIMEDDEVAGYRGVLRMVLSTQPDLVLSKKHKLIPADDPVDAVLWAYPFPGWLYDLSPVEAWLSLVETWDKQLSRASMWRLKPSFEFPTSW